MTNAFTDNPIYEIGETQDDGDPLSVWETPDPYRPRATQELTDNLDGDDEAEAGTPAPRAARRAATDAAEAEPVPDFDAGAVHAAFAPFAELERLQREDRYTFADRLIDDPTVAAQFAEWKGYLKRLNTEYGADLPQDATVREVRALVLGHNKAITSAAQETASATKATSKRATTRTATKPAASAEALDWPTIRRAYVTELQREGVVSEATRAAYAKAQRAEFGPD